MFSHISADTVIDMFDMRVDYRNAAISIGGSKMLQHYIIKDKTGRVVIEGEYTEPEVRMVARAGYRVFEGSNNEITPKLTGLFNPKIDNGFNEFK